ncbi:hypothetical protein CHELA40_15113 [Chelatococcus asaccharovorans]|nr:hypothetical protein CHELA17_60506 [Chelatococcus asaccharovorans]CAH1681541.1 hypothetical protein CHELA40_15113 [Chelatococcus asaccharovorans]
MIERRAIAGGAGLSTPVVVGREPLPEVIGDDHIFAINNVRLGLTRRPATADQAEPYREPVEEARDKDDWKDDEKGACGHDSERQDECRRDGNGQPDLPPLQTRELDAPSPESVVTLHRLYGSL